MIVAKDEIFANKLCNIADTLDRDIQKKRSPRLDNTPKRQKQARKARIESDHLERAATAMRVFAEASRMDAVPQELKHLKTKAQFLAITQTKTGGAGYYDIFDTGEYYDNSDIAKIFRAFVTQRSDSEKTEKLAAQRKIEDLEAKLKFSDIPGFFPTPPAVIDRMLELAELRDRMSILEPSCGKGDILEAAFKTGFYPGSIGVEINSLLAEICKEKKLAVWNADFLKDHWWSRDKTSSFDSAFGFERILMNPPFENLADIDHVLHAFGFLKPGGRLVSVMSNSPFFRQDRKALAFRDWLSVNLAEIIDLPEDSFKSAFRATGVQTKLIVVDRR